MFARKPEQIANRAMPIAWEMKRKSGDGWKFRGRWFAD
jgi:predicted chitinase